MILDGVRVVELTAWVAGPCGNCAGWYDGGRRAWFVSEADGSAHLYSVAKGGGDRRQLTSGSWEVLDVELSADGSAFELTTNEGSPFEQHYFRMPIAGGAIQPANRPGGRSARHPVRSAPRASRCATPP